MAANRRSHDDEQWVRWRPGAAEYINEQLKKQARRVAEHLIPEGELIKNEWCSSDINGGNGASFKINIHKGLWKEWAHKGEPGGKLLDLIILKKGGNPEKSADTAKGIDEAFKILGIDPEPWQEPVERRTKPRGNTRHSKSDDYEFITAIPDNAPPKPEEYPSLGKPDDVHAYLGADDRPARYVYRYDAKPGRDKKVFLPLTLWRQTASGHLLWRWTAAPAPLSLYKVNELAAHPEKRILIVEGEKTCDATASYDLPDTVVTAWEGGSARTAETDLSPLKGRSIVLWPDADEAGRHAMHELAARLAGELNTIPKIVRLPEEMPEGSDLADPFPAGWTMDTIIDLIDRAEPFQQTKPTATPGVNGIRRALIILRDTDIVLDDGPEFQIEGLTTAGGKTLLYGGKGSHKSFIANQMANAIARAGLWTPECEWPRPKFFGREVIIGGPVVRIAAEGGKAGNSKRQVAYRQYDPFPYSADVPYLLIPERINVRDTDDLAWAIQEIKACLIACGYPDPVEFQIDTLAANAGASDESIRDHAEALIGTDQIKEAFPNCHILIIHHCGKNKTKGARGGSNLPAAVDDVLYVESKKDKGTLTVEHLRDGETNVIFEFHKEKIEVSADREGRPRSSVYLEFDGKQNKETTNQEDKLSPMLVAARRALADTINTSGNLTPSRQYPNKIPPQQRCVTLGQWRQALAEAGELAGQRADDQFKRRIRGLKDKGVIAIHKEWVWLVVNV